MVAVAQMCRLVGQDVTQGLVVLDAARGQIDYRAKQTYETGAGDIGADSHPHRCITRKRFCVLAGPVEEQQIGNQEPCGYNHHAAHPNGGKDLLQSRCGDLLLGFLLQLLLDCRGHRTCHLGRLRSGRGRGGGGGFALNVVSQKLLIHLGPGGACNRILQRLLYLLNRFRPLLQLLRHGSHTVLGMAKLDRNQ